MWGIYATNPNTQPRNEDPETEPQRPTHEPAREIEDRGHGIGNRSAIKHNPRTITDEQAHGHAGGSGDCECIMLFPRHFSQGIRFTDGPVGFQRASSVVGG